MESFESNRWRKRFQRLAAIDPLRLLAAGYASYVLIGWGALSLPLCQQGGNATPLDHLFTAASAVSTTGLVTVSTSASYSFLGEGVILALIQLGGLGYMTISSFIVMSVSGELSPFRKKISETAIGLPEKFSIRSFLAIVCGFTFAVEIAGAAALYPRFAAHQAPNPAWQAIFHSVSAFCTAGFGLFNNSLEDYRGDAWLNGVVMTLSFFGAIGFIVVHDAWASLRSRKRQLTQTSRIILWTTAWISIVGTVLFALQEPTARNLPPLERWMASAFQVMTASTTVGFNTLPIGALSASSVLLLTAAMIIGASPSGTGGGLKTTTFSALWAEMTSVARRRPQTTFAGKLIPERRMRAATASVMFYALALTIGVYALSLTEAAPLEDLAFECASALGTVGLSRGITGDLSTLGKVIIIALMFAGRVGPVLLAMSLFSAPRFKQQFLEEDVVV
jgi:trk system potassium uptake protein TrkH